MNYDKNSFLAGISVGRTLKGWAGGSEGFSGGGSCDFPNGTEWMQSNISKINVNHVHNANGIWVACSYSHGLYYSADGKNWEPSNITSGEFYAVYNANGIWVVGSSYKGGVYYSIDGKAWVQSNITQDTVYSVYNANGIWVACSAFDRGIYYSVSWELNE